MLKFKFILGTEEFKVKYGLVFQENLTGIDKESLKEGKYFIKTEIRKENMEIFIDFLEHCSYPNINISNLKELKDLSEELCFKSLNNFISSFEKKIVTEKQIIEFIRNNNNKEEKQQEYISKCQKFITKNLDLFLTEYWEIMKKLEFKEIYEIFIHPNRKLINEERGYRFIKEKFQETGKTGYKLIFHSFHAEEMSEEMIEEIYSNSEEDEIEFIPQFHKTFLNKVSEEIREEIRKEFDKGKDEMKEMIRFDKGKQNENYDNEIENQKRILLEMRAEIEKDRIKMKTELKEEIEKEVKKEEDERKKINNEHNIKIDDMRKMIEELKKKIQCLKEKIIVMNSKKRIKSKKSEEEGGILQRLKEKEKPFEPIFISSISSRDPYDLMRSNWNDVYFSSSGGDFFIEFEIEKPENIKGILIKSADRSFMKRYQILIDGNIIYKTNGNVKERESLNGQNKEIKIEFKNQMKGNQIIINQKGKNWDGKENEGNFIGLRRIEIFSEEHPEGIFEAMKRERNIEDPHLLPVKIKTNLFSLESFYLLNTDKIVCTTYADGEYFEIDFLKGIVCLDGYRLGRRDDYCLMKGWRIDGQRMFDEEWKEITSFSEMNENKKKIRDVYDINTNLMMKKIRLIRTEPNYDNTKFLGFKHFDIFGEYIEITD